MRIHKGNCALQQIQCMYSFQSIFSVSFVNINGLPTVKDKWYQKSKQLEEKEIVTMIEEKYISSIFREIGDDTNNY